MCAYMLDYKITKFYCVVFEVAEKYLPLANDQFKDHC